MTSNTVETPTTVLALAGTATAIVRTPTTAHDFGGKKLVRKAKYL
jgi:hypothetical protein